MFVTIIPKYGFSRGVFFYITIATHHLGQMVSFELTLGVPPEFSIDFSSGNGNPVLHFTMCISSGKGGMVLGVWRAMKMNSSREGQ